MRPGSTPPPLRRARDGGSRPRGNGVGRRRLGWGVVEERWPSAPRLPGLFAGGARGGARRGEARRRKMAGRSSAPAAVREGEYRGAVGEQ